MNQLRGFGLGLESFGQSFKFIMANKLWWYYIIPPILYLSLMVVSFMFTGDLVGYWRGLFDHWISEQTVSWDYWDEVSGFLSTLIEIGIRLLFFFVFAYIGGFLVIILLSPVLAIISEQTSRIVSGETIPFDFGQLIKDVIRGIGVALRNFFIESILTILIIIFGFIPIIGWIAPLLLFAVSAYFYGFSFIDYCNERAKLNFSESSRLIRKNKGFTIGLSFFFCAVLLIPFIGSFIAGFLAINCTVGAALAYHRLQPQ